MMTVSEGHKIENDGDPWQPTCWLQMAHNDEQAYTTSDGVYPMAEVLIITYVTN